MSCHNCHLHESCRTPCLPGHGNPNASLFILGECPGSAEDYSGVPFVGLAGKLLDFVLAKLSLDRQDIFISNVVKCRPPENKLPTGAALQEIVDACWPHLKKELQSVDPKVVVLMGNTALKLICESGIKKLEGMEVDTVYEGAKTFACLHPAFVLRSPSYEASLGRALFVAAKAAGMKPRSIGESAGRFDYDVRGV